MAVVYIVHMINNFLPDISEATKSLIMLGFIVYCEELTYEINETKYSKYQEQKFKNTIRV